MGVTCPLVAFGGSIRPWLDYDTSGNLLRSSLIAGSHKLDATGYAAFAGEDSPLFLKSGVMAPSLSFQLNYI